MDDTDIIPVRETGHHGPSKKSKLDDQDALAQRAAQQRALVSRWSRDDLEDKHLRLYEENLILKKHARKQEEKIKRMATKLLRLVSDKKKSEEHGVKKMRDIETEEMLEELHGKIRETEKQNVLLKEKLMVMKQQLATQGSRKSPYPHVQSRINTGIAKPPGDIRLAKSLRVTGPSSASYKRQVILSSLKTHQPRGSPSPALPRYGHSLLEETRAENRHLEDVIQQLHEQINIYEQDVEMLKEQMRIRESEYEEDLLKIKQQMSQGQRTAIQENIDVIRLQREVKEKSTKLLQLQAQYQNLEEKIRMLKSSHDQVLYEMDVLNQQLKEEQNKSLSLQNELKAGNSSQRALIEYQERVADLERECEILKEANEKLVSSAFDLEREREWRQRESTLRVQVAQLEATLKADVGEKGSILDKLSEERDGHEKLEEEHRELRIQYFQTKQQYDDLHDKMTFFTKESAVDFQEIEEALMLVKQRKEKQSQELDFLQKVDGEKVQDYEKLVKEMQAEHAETINELEKTRNMLIVQHKINKDYQIEVDAVTRKMEDDTAEYETRLKEYAQLLDIRAARIRKLEAQLRDVAYGTRQYRIQPQEEEMSDEEEDTVNLERGQNLFEIHIRKVMLSPEAVHVMGDEEPSIFCTWEFFEFEIQSTPVVKGPRSEFEFTSQYLVKVDDFFLHYLQKDSCTLELHQSFGTDYRTVAACQLKMKEILDHSHGRLHGTAQLTAVGGDEHVVNCGSVEYWVRLRVPMEQALRLYKERVKALGYIDSNLRATDQALEALDEDAAKRPPDNVNQLHIKISRCHGLIPRRDGVQPSPYCIYKFYDFPEHDTPIITGSNNPQFNDHKTYPVPMTADFDKYLKAQSLQVYVFDDTDPEETEYLGLVKVPFIPLAHDKSISGTFELKRGDGTISGSVDLSLKWQFAYLPPKASTKTLAQIQASCLDEPEPVHMLPGEEDALREAVVGGIDYPAPVSTPSREGRPPRPPIASSTPLPNRDRRFADGADHLVPIQPRDQHIPSPGERRSLHETSSIPEESERDSSIVSEGTPVPGESELVSEESGTVTPRQTDSPQPPQSSNTPTPPSLSQAAEQARADLERMKPDISVEEPSYRQDNDKMSDTMFDDDDEEDEDESEVDVEGNGSMRQGGEETGGETEDSEVVVLGTPSSRPQSASNTNNPGDMVTVIISHLSLTEDAAVISDDRYKMLYVEYRFLGAPLKETETPYSLPKPQAFRQISFNFTKVFHVDYENYYERRQYLASMLLPDDPDQGRIRFTLVSEPENDEDDCEDVGVAFVSVRNILDNGKDLVDQDIPIYSVEDESHEIGSINITVACLDALRAVQAEMQIESSGSFSLVS